MKTLWKYTEYASSDSYVDSFYNFILKEYISFQIWGVFLFSTHSYPFSKGISGFASVTKKKKKI